MKLTYVEEERKKYNFSLKSQFWLGPAIYDAWGTGNLRCWVVEMLLNLTIRGKVGSNNQGPTVMYFLHHKGTIVSVELLPEKRRLYGVLSTQPFKLPTEFENRRYKLQN